MMYPYKNKNTYPCFDNSPVIAEQVRTIIPKGHQIIPYFAIDKDLDSLVYSWGPPYEINPTFVISSYNTGYSYTNPLPDNQKDPSNIAATIDPTNGLLETTVYTQGAFVVNVVVKAYRQGILLSEVFRETQLIVKSELDSNTAPILVNNIDTSVFVGNTLNLSLSVMDFEFMPNNYPQNIIWRLSGSQLGNYYLPSGAQSGQLDTVGCPSPPCATLIPAHEPGDYLSGQFGLTSNFSWRTDCSHLEDSTGQYSLSRDYHFISYAEDSYCPVPASSAQAITVHVRDYSPLRTVDSLFAHFDYFSYDCKLSWNKIADPHSQFLSYNVYYAPNNQSPFVLIDSITNINSTQTTINNGLINQAFFYVVVKSRNHCQNNLSSPDTAHAEIQQTGLRPDPENHFSLLPCQPNPSRDFTNIHFILPQTAVLDYRLMDSHGRMLEQRKVHANLGENHITQATLNLEAGIYFYSLEWEGVLKTGRIVVLK